MRQGWEVKKLGEVCEKISRGISPKYIEKNGVIVLNQKCIRDHKINFEPSRKHDEINKNVTADKYIRIGDVLVNSTGEGTLGRVAQVRDLPNEKVTVDSHISIVRPMKDKFFLDFFGWAMTFIENEIANSGAGASGQTELARTVLENNFTLVYPKSILEQQRIVTILGEVFTAIDKAKANAEQNLKNSKELFESYLQSVFENKGADWEVNTLGEIADVQYGYTDKSTDEGEFRYVRITDIDRNGELILEDKKYLKYSKEAEGFLIQDNDLLMARTGATFAKVLLFKGNEPSVFASYLIRIKFKDKIENELYWYFTKTKGYWEQANRLQSGAAQPHFNGAAVKQVIFSYPKSLEKQKLLIQKFRALSFETKKLEAIYHSKIKDLEELKKAVLQKAFLGGLNLNVKAEQ